MLDENGTVQLRSKLVKYRPLDKFKIKEEATLWKAIKIK